MRKFGYLKNNKSSGKRNSPSMSNPNLSVRSTHIFAFRKRKEVEVLFDAGCVLLSDLFLKYDEV